jgi:hypothetical protein
VISSDPAATSNDPTVLERRPGSVAPVEAASRDRVGRVAAWVSLGLLATGAALVWRYLLAPPSRPLILAPSVDAAGATPSTGHDALAAALARPDASAAVTLLRAPRAFDPRALSACERELDATPQGALVSRRGVLSDDFVVLLTAIDDAFANATPAGPGPVREDVERRLTAAQLGREAHAATSCLFQAGALPSGLKSALEAFLRRNDPYRLTPPVYDVTALAALLEPRNSARAAAVLRAGGQFRTWRDGGGLLNPALRDRQAALRRLAELQPEDPLVRASTRYLQATDAAPEGSVAVEILSVRPIDSELVVAARVRNGSDRALPLSPALTTLAGSGAPRAPSELPPEPLSPGETRDVELRYPAGLDEPLVFVGPPERRAWAGPLR